MSVHLDDKNTADILKELEVNIQISRLSEVEIRDATSSKISLKTRADHTPKQANKEDIGVMKPKKVIKQSTFKVAAHGIRKRKRVYNFKCKVQHCDETFKSIRAGTDTIYSIINESLSYLMFAAKSEPLQVTSVFTIMFIGPGTLFVIDVINILHSRVRWWHTRTYTGTQNCIHSLPLGANGHTNGPKIWNVMFIHMLQKLESVSFACIVQMNH